MYVNVLRQIMIAGKGKREYRVGVLRLHLDFPITELLARNMDLICAHLRLLTNKTNGGSKYVARTSHRHLELNKQNVWEGTRKEKSMSK